MANAPAKITRYGLEFDHEWDDAQIEMYMIRKNGAWTDSSGRTFGKGLPFHYERMRQLCWPRLDSHRWHVLCRDEILKNKVTVLMGPASCVAGHTKIENPITGEAKTIKELYESQVRPVVMTLVGPTLAGIPFVKGYAELFEVRMTSGRKFTATSEHRVLTERGYVAVSSLQRRQCLISFCESRRASTWEPDRQWFGEDVSRYLKIIQDSEFDYQFCRRSDDARPPALLIRGSNEPTSLSGVATRTALLPLDGLACKQAHSRHRPEFVPPSNATTSPLFLKKENASFSRASSGTLLHAVGLSEPRLQSQSVNSPNQPSEKPGFYFSRSCLDDEMPCTQYRVQRDAVQEIKSVGCDIFYDLCVPNQHHYFAEGVIHHNSGKTHEAAWTALVDYWAFPNETCVLVSSTDIRGLKKRVWGEIAMLWEEAVAKFPWLAGNLLDASIAIATDSLEDCEPGERKVRDMRKGIFGVPCVQGSKWVGLTKFQGIKQKRMRLVADEASAMNESFLSSFSNLSKNEDFKAVILGNPNDPLDPLGRAAEPKEGWTDEYLEPGKTKCWDTRFMGGRCVNLIGLDSPNFDFSADKPTRYKYLISREKIQDTLSFFQKDSIEYYSQCVGSMKIGTMARRVITRRMCEQFGALDDVVWDGAVPVKNFAGLDSAYGGDRCALTKVQLGTSVDGKQVLRINPAVIVPISVSSPLIAEVQIAQFCKSYCLDNDIPPEHFGHDSTGRGSLGTFLAQAWSSACVPVEFGGSPTKRPVSLDLLIEDQETGVRRPKRCDEHFIKWVTEAWFVIRMAIEAGQIKNLPEETMSEGCLRDFDLVKDKYELETKTEMKERVGRSPDLFDSLVVAVEVARRKGFQIAKLGNNDPKKPRVNYLDTFARDHEQMMRSKELQHA